MTFAALRALQAIIAAGIDDIERVFASESASGARSADGSPSTDFPALDVPGDPDSRAEALMSHPEVLSAVARIVSAADHLAATVRAPFLTLCNAGMGYHLTGCLRFLEAAHIPELLSNAGPDGMLAGDIARRVGVDASTTGHILRLLATHHLLREVRPDCFALNRISALLDSGKTFEALSQRKEWKYDGRGQKAAFFAVNSDELFKAGAYLTDMLLPHAVTDDAALPPAAFNLSQRTATPYWAWLEAPGNEARLARFGCAMGGSQGWEEVALQALGDHPFPELPDGAVVVDVGGGIGATTVRLAERFARLKFIVQDRAPVCRLGEEALRARNPEMLSSGRSVRAPAVFLVRTVCHDWPDDFARRILLQLRRAAGPMTRLVIGEHILPYAVAGARDGATEHAPALADIAGARDVQLLRGARWPLLANLGTASANVYWMDLTMKTIFNGKERTLPEHVALAASAGWRVVRVSGIEGSLFGHIVALPGPLPADVAAQSGAELRARL
ncbi:S-adenosyl-L-methionine-dependent methyltransferase [Vararia minispora EC-137]|uniref:S-adenosyl-L-methionine-dependent methyltransferase n=1 Tax=Vararia minispora EC-137 TaxID=1314806 RepID=A0ACB8Q8T4_9AGAM|nr:S-adenosyl-L-methionine-dependent methyltransferase [Vararia minispora EC-137]